MILSKRIENLVAYSGLTIPKFAKFVGFKTPQAVRELINGRTKTLSESAALLIMRAFPDIDEGWLRNGIGVMLTPVSSKNIGEVSYGGMAQQGDNFTIFKDVNIQIEEELASDVTLPGDLESSHGELKKLRRLLAKAEKEIARLNGKIEEQDRFIKLLIEKK